MAGSDDKMTSALRLAVVLTDACAAPQALRRVFGAGTGIEVLEGVEAALAARGPMGVLVPVSDPVRALAQLLQDGLSVDEAVGRWVAAAHDLFRLRPDGQRRIVLADDRALLAGDADLEAQIARRLRVAMPAVIPVVLPDLPSAPIVAALALLHADPDLVQILSDWRAGVLGAEAPVLSSAALADVLEPWLQGLMQARTEDRPAESPADTLAELAALREVMARQVEQLAVAAAQVAAAAGPNPGVQEELAALREIMARQEEHLTAAAAPDPAVQAERDALRTIAALQVDQLAQATAEAAAAELRIESLTRERDAALAPPLPDPELAVQQAIIKTLERRLADAAALQGEREAVLAAQILGDGRALSAVEAQLDEVMARSAAQAADWGARRAALEVELSAAHDRLSQADSEIGALRAEIELIKTSISWKVTEPLRAGRRLLGGE